MAQLVKTGDSQVIKIPKPLIAQAGLEGKELKLRSVEAGLLISPKRRARQGWAKAIEQTIATHGQEALREEWLNFPLDCDETMEW